MKTIITLAVLVLMSGCIFAVSRQGYRNLDYKQTVSGELKTLESTVMPSIQLSDVSLTLACQTLSAAYSELPATGFLNIALVKDVEIGMMKVNLSMKNASLAEVYDELCEQTHSTWSVNRYIYIEPRF